ncbi:Ig-like domain-containing protein [Candidatus Kaiserbacteria bacterium]|nr:Ig-like domain-containing protein [Candidatus Kaiserbacteria bacterium]
MKTKNIPFGIFIGTTAVLALFFIATLVFAWSGPSANPPAGNVFTPINVTSTGQVKAGGFWASAVGSDSGYCIGGSCISSWPTDLWTSLGVNLYYTSGNVGIGTAAPVTTLDVNGYMRLAVQSSAPMACSATYDGVIALNSVGWVCICNGSTWIADSTGAACSWVPDTTAPTVTLTAPAAGTVSGTIAVSATSSDNVGVVGVQFQLDGANLSAEDTTSPYSISWNTTTATNGSHNVTAVARDAAGNTTTYPPVLVTVNNADVTPPTVVLTVPADGATVSGTTAVSATASDNVGVAGVQFKLDGANLGAEDTTSPYSISWNTTTAASGSHTLTAVARDAAGNTTTSAAHAVTVPDTAAPTVSITAPANGATVSGTTAVSATASDNVGVAGVQFKLDGENLGAEDTTSPYSVSWDTTSATNGSSHTLTATARDAAGNTTTSTSISVTVSNGR